MKAGVANAFCSRTILEVAMTSTAPSRRRNSRLTAFYGLQGSEDGNPDSDGAEATSSSPNHRASDLIGQTPLAALLTTAASLRESRDASYVAQNASVKRCYGQLSEAVSAASKAAEHASQTAASPDSAQSAISRIRGAAKDAAAVDSLLAPASTRIDALEDARKVSLLLQASKLLSHDISADYAAMVDLCLDPVGARTQLRTTAMRFAALRPVLARAAEESRDFAEAQMRVEEAAAAVRADLEARMSSGSGTVEGLELLDVVKLRMLLGDASSHLKLAFLRASELNMTTSAPPKAAVEAASTSWLSLATFYISFARSVTLPALLAACDTYFDMFVSSGESVCYAGAAGGSDSNFPKDPHGAPNAESSELAEEFTSWLVDVVDTTVGSRVRGALTSESLSASAPRSLVGNLGSMESIGSGLDIATAPVDDEDFSSISFGDETDAIRFSEEVEGFRSAAYSASKTSKSACELRIAEVIGAICDDMKATALHVVCERSETCVKSRTSSLLARNYSASSGGRISTDVEGLVRLIKSCQRSTDDVVLALGENSMRLPGIVAEYILMRVGELGCVDSMMQDEDEASDLISNCGDVATASPGIDTSAHFRARSSLAGSRMLLTGAVVMDALRQFDDGSMAPSAVDLLRTRSQLVHMFGLRISADVTNILRTAVSLSAEPDSRSTSTPGSQVSHLGCRAITLLENARRDASVILGPASEVDVLFGTEEGILDEGGIIQRVSRGWVCCIREETLPSANAVHGIQVDSAALDVAMGTSDTFSQAPRVALDRCAISNVKLLPPEEVSRRIARTAALS